MAIYTVCSVGRDGKATPEWCYIGDQGKRSHHAGFDVALQAFLEANGNRTRTGKYNVLKNGRRIPIMEVWLGTQRHAGPGRRYARPEHYAEAQVNAAHA